MERIRYANSLEKFEGFVITTHEKVGTVVNGSWKVFRGRRGINPTAEGTPGFQEFHPVALFGQGRRRGNSGETATYNNDFAHQSPVHFHSQQRPTAPVTESSLSHLERVVRPLRIR